VLKKALEERADLLALLVVALFAEVDNGLGLRGGTLARSARGARFSRRSSRAGRSPRSVRGLSFARDSFFCSTSGAYMGTALGAEAGSTFFSGLGAAGFSAGLTSSALPSS